MIQARESKSTPPPVSWAARVARSRGSACPVAAASRSRAAPWCVPQAEDEVVGGGAVPAVVDGLVHVGEADLGEAGRGQDVLGDGRIGEGERVLAARGRGGWGGRAGEGLADRGARVGEEHRAEPADAAVEMRRREGVDLGVGQLVADVGQSVVLAAATGKLQGRREADPQDAARSTPAKARRTGKPSPSRPEGAVVTETTGRSVASGPGSGTRGRAIVSAVTAGIALASRPFAQVFLSIEPAMVADATFAGCNAAAVRACSEAWLAARFHSSAPGVSIHPLRSWPVGR
jgi:hypothetical protein